MISKGHNEWTKHDTMTCQISWSRRSTSGVHEALRGFRSQENQRVWPLLLLPSWTLWDPPRFSLALQTCHLWVVEQIPAKGQVIGAAKPNRGKPAGLGDGCLLTTRVAHKGQPLNLLMEPRADAAGKAIKKLSFCLFCMYLASNDPSYMNHIICGHYNTNYGWRKCLKEVFITGQPLKNHMKVCKGLPKETTNAASMGDVGCTPAMPEKKKHTSKDPSPDSWLPSPQSS